MSRRGRKKTPYRNRSARRRGRARRAKKRSRMAPSKRQISFLPNSMRAVHTFNNVVSLTVGASTGNQEFWNGNSLSHCYNNTLGEQAYGFDQLGPLYHKYRVNACKITLRIVPIGGGAGSVFGINTDMATQSLPTVASSSDVIEKCKRHVILGNTDGANNQKTLSLFVKTRSQDVTDPLASEGVWDVTTPVVPTDIYAFRLLFWNTGTVSYTFRVFATLKYYTVWKQPQEQAGSA